MEVLIDILYLFKFIFDFLFITYAIVIIITYIILAIISGLALRAYLKKNKNVNYNSIISTPLAPSISIIAPAYNESVTIIENIRALLSIFYNDFEVIVVNDGSKDDSLEKVIKAYDLVKVDFAVNYQVNTKEVKGVYKSKNKSFEKLTVVDKVNGGKADALNVGINISEKDLFVAIDVDSIIEPDALLKLVKPFLDETDKKIIATGGVIRIANSCLIEGGHIVKVNAPKQFLPSVQVLEYTRAFLMGRMAWSKLDGLLLISGALGLFDRNIVIKAGGYAHTVGEDMELIVRMRRYMCENNLQYRVEYIPDPLCWTEAPSSLKILGRQRNRWTRGTIDTLKIHKKIFFNKKYGRMGTLGYPYWYFFEWLAPLVEVLGFIYLIILSFFGLVNWPYFILMLFFVYSFAMAFSSWALVFEELTFHKYEKKTDIIKLFITAHLEPIIYHPLTLIWAVKGNIDYFRGKTGWGKMERAGFKKKLNNIKK